MNQTVKIPDIGTDEAVEIIEFNLVVGDTVNVDDPLLTLESDKASMDIPSEFAGTITAIKVTKGDKVKTGDVILDLQLAQTAEEASSDVADNPVQDTSTLLASEHTVYVPDLGTSDAVEVIDICVAVGDTLEVDSPTITLESDKASMDIPSDAAGKVSKILVAIGDKLKQGDAILNLEQSAVTGDSNNNSVSTQNVTQTNTASRAIPVNNLVLSNRQDKLHAGPAVRRLAHELNIDLKQIQPTGPRGRITEKDILNLVKLRMQGSSNSIDQGVELAEIEKFGVANAVDMSRIQKLTAKSMSNNWRNIPHVTQFADADITDLEVYRKSIKDLATEKGIKLTILPFIVKAAALALKQLPQFNVALGINNQIIHKEFINISVAMDTPHGLVVPVIKNVDNKDIWQIALDITELYAKACDNKLQKTDIQGGCFTISSLGSVGGKYFTPIINAPEVAILGVSKSSKQPVYDNNQFIARNILPLSLSFDHRVINGVDGAKMTNLFAELLSDYSKLM